LGEEMKIIKTRTTTYHIDWIAREFMPYDETFRQARARAPRRAKMNRCFKCNHPFDDGEMMALASMGKHGNRTICQQCADELEEA
jgi:hypothetical protein